MNQWKVFYTEQANSDLRRIFEYIAFSLLEQSIAEKQTARILDAIAKLDQMPERFRLYEKEPWHSKGLRVMPVDNYLVFFHLLEHGRFASIIRIMYGGRNIDEQLSNSDLNLS